MLSHIVRFVRTGSVVLGILSVAPQLARASAGTANVGQSVSFSVTVNGTAPFSYQWRKDNVSIPGANSATYSLPSVTLADAGTYTVAVANSAGSTVSDNAALTVNAVGPVAPTITSQPAGTTVTAGQPASFTVVASGTAPLTYQWKRNGTAIAGATAATYSIASTVWGDSANFSVVVTNAAGSATSVTANLSVNSAPVITAQTGGASVTAGQPVTFSVAAYGTTPFAYQWKKNGAAIAGATGASYAIASATTADAGGYSVSISNYLGTASSASATLTVVVPMVAPTITSQPTGTTVTAGQPASFTVVASGTAPLTYQWKRNGTAIAGATAATYSIVAATAADSGSYSVHVANPAGSAASEAADLTVLVARPGPAILVEVVPVAFSARGQTSKNPLSRLFDGSAATKWQDNSGTSWVKVTVASPTVLEAYSLTSAADFPERDPAAWTLSGSNDGTTWTVLDTQTAQVWGQRRLTRDFALVPTPAAFVHFRFSFTATAGSVLQLAELELFKSEIAGAEPPDCMVQLLPASYAARGQRSNTFGVGRLFDADVATKWIDDSPTTWVQVTLPAPASLVAYGLVSGNNYPERDPVAWTVLGSNDGVAWTPIETRSAQAWSGRQLTRNFVLEQPSAAYRIYRFEFTATAGSSTQLAELDLFGF